MPRVSIILPTYNRADTIERALKSVAAQTFRDWELIVVDDGSSDGTSERIKDFDPRLRILRKEKNEGVTRARNLGLQAARGALIAFLDSDDEWLPHFLHLATSFFDAFPGEKVFTAEMWEDFGRGLILKHYWREVAIYAPQVARRIGSPFFDQPPPQDDPYLRFYAERLPLGAWARPALEGTPYASCFHYRGNIFPAWRWEFVMTVVGTVLTREALDQAGLPDESIPVASDYSWLAKLCRLFPVNMVALPGFIKHEFREARTLPTQGHLVTGSSATQFHLDMLKVFEELFWNQAPDDAELLGIRAYRQFRVGEAALLQGRRELAVQHLEQARAHYPGAEVTAMWLLARLVPHGGASRGLLEVGRRASALPGKVLRRIGRVLAPRAADGGRS